MKEFRLSCLSSGNFHGSLVLCTYSSITNNKNTKYLCTWRPRLECIWPRQCVKLAPFAVYKNARRPHEAATVWQTAPVCTGLNSYRLYYPYTSFFPLVSSCVLLVTLLASSVFFAWVGQITASWRYFSFMFFFCFQDQILLMNNLSILKKKKFFGSMH